MNIRKLSFGLITSTMMLGVFSGCSESKYEDKAKAQAAKYLNGYELLQAESNTSKQDCGSAYNAESVAYWDSLLIEAKAKEAYLRGQQVIKDSADGKSFKKEDYRFVFDTVYNDIKNSMNEYSKYTSAKDFIEKRNNAPSQKKDYFTSTNAPSTHYWYMLACTGRQREAYQKGMANARDSLRNR